MAITQQDVFGFTTVVAYSIFFGCVLFLYIVSKMEEEVQTEAAPAWEKNLSLSVELQKIRDAKAKPKTANVPRSSANLARNPVELLAMLVGCTSVILAVASSVFLAIFSFI